MLKEIKYKVKRPGTLGRHKRVLNTVKMKVINHELGIQSEKEAYDQGWHSVKTEMEPIKYTTVSLQKAYELGRLHRIRRDDQERRRNDPTSALHQVDNHAFDLQRSRRIFTRPRPKKSP